MDMYSLMVLETRSLKSVSSGENQAMLPLEAGGESFSSLFQLLVAAASLQSLPVVTLASPSMSHLCLPPSYEDTCDCIRAHPDLEDNLPISQDP